ncbi:MAG: hypothetical protein AB1384_03995 [Actinomycetota bacterium]
MENDGNMTTRLIAAATSVKDEIIDFFKANPFLLVSEARLAALLCRPPEMVCEAVAVLLDAGLLARRYGEALLCVKEELDEAGLSGQA